MPGLVYTYRHKDGATINVPVTHTALTDQQIIDLKRPTPEQTYNLLSESRLIAYYFDWEYESTTYTDNNGRVFIVMQTKGGG